MSYEISEIKEELEKEYKEKLLKKSIKRLHNNTFINKIDPYLKLSKVKILNQSLYKEDEKYIYYKVEYKYGFRLLNPIIWLIIAKEVLILFYRNFIDVILELKASSFNEIISINKEDIKDIF